jgi:hypothetical protein
MVQTPKAYLGSCRPGTKEATPGYRQASQQGDCLHMLNHQQCLDPDDIKLVNGDLTKLPYCQILLLM